MKKNYFKTLVIAGCFVAGMTSTAYATPYTGSDIEFLGNQYSDISAYVDRLVVSQENKWGNAGNGAIYTAWDGLWVEYTADLTAGNWNIGINAINRGNLGTNWYAQFEVENSLTGEKINIPASSTEVNYGLFNYDAANNGLYTVRYTWLNDKFDSPLDANIQINSAFFDNTATNTVPEPATMFLFGTGLVGLAGLRSRRKRSA